MIRYILRRLLNLIPVMLGVSLAAFATLYLLPGDPAALLASQNADPRAMAAIRAQHHLDDPLPVRYAAFLGRLVRGDLGQSIRQEGQPVARILLRRTIPTAQLAAGALIVALAFGVPAGLLGAMRPRSWADAAGMLLALIGVSMPVFWLGMVLAMLLTGPGSFFAVSGYQPLSLRYLTLPSLALGAVSAALFARMTRATVLETLALDHVRTARAKGASEWRVVIRHALRNALIPLVTVIGNSFAGLLTGAVLTETVFSIPGLGQEMVNAIDGRDYPVVIGGVVLFAAIFVLMNLAVDLLYGALDPRVRHT